MLLVPHCGQAFFPSNFKQKTEQATKVLETSPIGTFFLRSSGDAEGQFSVTYTAANGVANFLIDVEPNKAKVALENLWAPSVVELIEKLRSQGLLGTPLEVQSLSVDVSPIVEQPQPQEPATPQYLDYSTALLCIAAFPGGASSTLPTSPSPTALHVYAKISIPLRNSDPVPVNRNQADSVAQPASPSPHTYVKLSNPLRNSDPVPLDPCPTHIPVTQPSSGYSQLTLPLQPSPANRQSSGYSPHAYIKLPAPPRKDPVPMDPSPARIPITEPSGYSHLPLPLKPPPAPTANQQPSGYSHLPIPLQSSPGTKANQQSFGYSQLPLSLQTSPATSGYSPLPFPLQTPKPKPQMGCHQCGASSSTCCLFCERLVCRHCAKVVRLSGPVPTQRLLCLHCPQASDAAVPLEFFQSAWTGNLAELEAIVSAVLNSTVAANMESRRSGSSSVGAGNHFWTCGNSGPHSTALCRAGFEATCHRVSGGNLQLTHSWRRKPRCLQTARVSLRCTMPA